MQFSIFALASLIALALASPIAMPVPAEEIAIREAIAGDSNPAMTTSSGDIIPFDTAEVVLPLADAGQ